MSLLLCIAASCLLLCAHADTIVPGSVDASGNCYCSCPADVFQSTPTASAEPTPTASAQPTPTASAQPTSTSSDAPTPSASALPTPSKQPTFTSAVTVDADPDEVDDYSDFQPATTSGPLDEPWKPLVPKKGDPEVPVETPEPSEEPEPSVSATVTPTVQPCGHCGGK